MNVPAYVIGGGLPAGSLWFVIVYAACKGTFKRKLGWPFLMPIWLLVVVCTGIAGLWAMTKGPADPILGFLNTVIVPLAASLALTVTSFFATKARGVVPDGK